MNPIKQFSDALAALVQTAAPGLVHIGGDHIPGRTGLIWRDGLVLSLAREATDGEALTVQTADQVAHPATVQAWDARSGLVLLAVPDLKAPSWRPGHLPAVGSLALTVALASPAGVEAHLSTVRFVGGPTDWVTGVPLTAHFQTDAAAYPGFSGAVLLDPDGHLIGWLASNQGGNRGFALSAADLDQLGQALLDNGTRQRAYLGVNLRPVPGTKGLSLVSLEPDSPAAQAGWQTGDLLLSLAGTTLDHQRAFQTVIASLRPGHRAPARLLRGDQVLDLPITPGAR